MVMTRTIATEQKTGKKQPAQPLDLCLLMALPSR
jgi:hypothetical protein